MQIAPVSYNYANQKTQKNNQQSFGMSATQAMKDFWDANRLRVLTSPHYSARQATEILGSMADINLHPTTIVDYRDGALIISKSGQPDKTIKVESLVAIETAAKEL